MGVFLSNMHIKKNLGFTIDDLLDVLTQDLLSKGFKKLDSAENAEAEIVIYCPQDSEWISVASDFFEFSTENDTRSAAKPISEKLDTYVIAASCVDSDYAYMHLIGNKDGTDGWINSGTSYDGMKLLRRTSTVPWKKVVNDFEKFKVVTKEKYIFAEEMFCRMAVLLGMKSEQCLLEIADNEKLDEKNIIRLYFLPPEETVTKKEPPVLRISRFPLTPCASNMFQVIPVNNKGGRSKGIAVMFTGDYIENDEIEIYNAEFLSRTGSEKHKITPISFTKKKTADGKAMLYWEDKDFQIPPAVNSSLPIMKQQRLEFEKEFGIRFYARGNERKFLDIMVFIIPLENYQKGADCWYVYRYSGTKKKFVEERIKDNKEFLTQFPESERQKLIEVNPYLNITDPNMYDLD